MRYRSSNGFELLPAVVLALTLVLDGMATAQEVASSAPREKPAKEEILRKKLKKRSQELAEASRFYRVVDGERVQIPIVKKPILDHNDAERGELGGIWLVGDKGRPLAVANAWTTLTSSGWVFSVRSLSPSKDVAGLLADSSRPWMPKDPGIEFAPIPGTKAPSKNARVRFTQLKKYARRFNGHEFWQGGRHELGLLVRELHRYQDPESGIIEGALFSIAHGTNTECFLMIEVQEKNGKQDWYYGLGRFGYAELHINIDKKEVWEQPAVGSGGGKAGSQDPYFLFNLRKTIR